MRKLANDDKIALCILATLLVPVIWYSVFIPFEGDTGDSVVHYFFARYSFGDPRLLLDHWAKPFFTLLASPFAQFGFAGIKLFNGLVGLSSAGMAYLLAKKLDLRFPWLAIVFVLFSPDYFVRLFSGYTEPLFGLILLTAIYFAIIEKYSFSAIFVSFLPFVRSEGLIIIAVFAFYLILVKKWRSLLFLPAGQILYSLTGFLSGKNILWIFTEIPYQVKSVYGKGDFFHYPNQWLLTLGVPLFALCVTGIMLIVIRYFSRRNAETAGFRNENFFLLLGSFLAYFLFHTLSWGLGLFGSMGMSRVLCALVPLQGVISLIALDFLTNQLLKFRSWLLIGATFLIVGYVLVFPFLHNPASINWKKDLCRTPDMIAMHTLASDIQKAYPGKFLYYSNPYLSYALNINPFDRSKHLCFTDWQIEKRLKSNSLLIWDNWYSVVEERTDSSFLLKDTSLKLISRYGDGSQEPAFAFLIFSFQ